jgi:hypothetical protein
LNNFVCTTDCRCVPPIIGPAPGTGPGTGPGPGGPGPGGPGPGGPGPGGPGAGGTDGTAGTGGVECPPGSGICGTVYGTQECIGVGSYPRGVWCGTPVIANCCKLQCPYTCPPIRSVEPQGPIETDAGTLGEVLP